MKKSCLMYMGMTLVMAGTVSGATVGLFKDARSYITAKHCWIIH